PIWTIEFNISFGFKKKTGSKRRFERDCKEAERAQQASDRMDLDNKTDGEKQKQQAAEESRSFYLSSLSRFNQDQQQHYHSLVPVIYQDMEERRIERVGDAMRASAEAERKVLPEAGRCLDAMMDAAQSIQPRKDTRQVVELFKSGFDPPGDVDFEDYSATMRRSISESSYLDNRTEGRRHSRKLWPFIRKNKVTPKTDCSNLQPEQRRKKLQSRIENISQEIQREREQRDALLKMVQVYQLSPQLGDVDSLEPRLEEVKQSLQRLEEELHRNQRSVLVWVPGGPGSWRSGSVVVWVPGGLEGCEPVPVLLPGQNEGTLSMVEGELLSVVEEDKGDGWTRVRRSLDEEGYVPTSYIKVFLDSSAKGAMTYI
uniref:Formin binding protein 1a n=1 Tax=Salarias fasciatus TaxID=181472 RepID=A0A672G113_SALFA